MKFGEVLNSIKQGFEKMSSQTNSVNGGIIRENRNFDIHKALRNNLADLVNQAQKTAEEIEKIEQLKFQAEAAGRRDLALLYKGQLDREITAAKRIEEERKKIEKDFSDVEKKIIENRVKGAQKLKKSYGDLSNIEEDYSNKLKTLIEARSRGFITEEKYRKLASNLDYLKKTKQALQIASQDQGSIVQSFLSLIGNGLGSLLNKILPGFGLIVDGIVALAKEAWKQMIEENNTLINILRKTGGVVSPGTIGYTQAGTSTNGFGSLSLDVLKSNISMQEFSESLSSLFQGPMGQTVGMKTNLRNAAGEMQNYALTAAKMTKLWGVDVSETVANLTMDYGMSVGSATTATESFSYSAKELGLNMKFAAKNLERVSAMTSKYYFRSFDQMSKLAMLATNLGVNVDGLVEGANKMTSMTDLFTQQQEAASFEMGNLANNMSQIYALNATGSEAEASKIKLMAAYQDLVSRGLYDRRGMVSAMGLTTVKQMGFNEDEIKALNRLGKLSKGGVSAQAALNPELQTKMDKERIRGYEIENRTLSESLYIAVKEIIQPIISFVQNLLGPLTTDLIKLLYNVADFIGPVFEFMGVLVNIIKPVFIFLGGVIQGIGEVFSLIGNWLKIAVSWLKQFTGYLDGGSKWIEKFGQIIGATIATILILEGLLLVWKGIMFLVNSTTIMFNWIMRGQLFASLRKFAIMIVTEVLPALGKFLLGLMSGLRAFLSQLGPAGWAVLAGLTVAGVAATQFANDLTKSDEKINKNQSLDDKIWSDIYRNSMESKGVLNEKKNLKNILPAITTDNSALKMKQYGEHAWNLSKQKNYVQPTIINTSLRVDGMINQTMKQQIKVGGQ